MCVCVWGGGGGGGGGGGRTMEIKGKKTNIQIKALNGEDTLESEAIS